MKTTEFMSFGNFIAFALPGAVAARAAAYIVPSLQHAFTALAGATNEAAGPIFFVTVAALAAGVTLNTIRRALFDPALNRLGPRRTPLDYSRLTESNRERFADALEGVYRPYEFTANMALALVLVVAARFAWGPLDAGLTSPLTMGAAGLAAALTLIARTQLRASYRVLAKILGMPQAESSTATTKLAVPAAPAASGGVAAPATSPQSDSAQVRKDWPPE